MRPQAKHDCNTKCENVHILITIVNPMRLGRWPEIMKELSLSLSLTLVCRFLYARASQIEPYGMCSSGAVSTLCFVWKFACITFHLLIHACMYINYACNLIDIHQ